MGYWASVVEGQGHGNHVIGAGIDRYVVPIDEAFIAGGIRLVTGCGGGVDEADVGLLGDAEFRRALDFARVFALLLAAEDGGAARTLSASGLNEAEGCGSKHKRKKKGKNKFAQVKLLFQTN